MKLKKIVAFLLSAVLLLSAFTVAVSAASGSIFKVDIAISAAETYAPGDAVSVTVKAVQNTGFDYLKLKISYNADALEYVDATNHAVFGKSNTETFLPKDGYVLYTALTNNVATQTGNMFTLNFKVKEGFCGNVDVVAQLSADNPKNCMITDPKLKEVVPFVGDSESFVMEHKYESKVTAPDCVNSGYTTYTCSVCGYTYDDNAVDALGHTYDNDCDATCNVCEAVREVADHVYDDEYDADCNICGATREVPEKPVDTAYGDCNNDGEINNRDLVMLQQYLNNWDVTVDTAAADCNNDGEINNRDLVLLQQYLNNWDVTLG